MKICIPLESNRGLKAKINAHFGSASCFLIYDTDTETFEVIENSDKEHAHGMCHPLKVLENQNIDAVICRGMGARAVQKINEGGIKAYKTGVETVEDVIAEYKEDGLEEITAQNACTNHNCHK